MAKKFTQILRRTILARSFRVLSKKQRKKFVFLSILQVIANLLDLVAVALAGFLGALAVSGIQIQQPGSRTEKLLSFLYLTGKPIQVQVMLLGLLTAALLITRTVISILLLRNSLYFLSNCGAKISKNMSSKLFNLQITDIKQLSSQETVFALTRGIDSLTVGILGTSISIISDLCLLLMLLFAVLFVDLQLALGTIVVITLFIMVFYFLLSKRAERIGTKYSTLAITTASKVTETIQTYRELFVHNRRNSSVDEIGRLRSSSAKLYSEIAFLPSISKYSLESLVVLSVLGISAVQFFSLGAENAVSGLAVFMAAASRIAPAALRIQQGAIQLKSSTGPANISLELLERLNGVSLPIESSSPLVTQYDDFAPELGVQNLSFSYDARGQVILDNLTFEVKRGAVIGIVGPSGSGKSTLADLLLGVITPNRGTINISGERPIDAIRRWPGAISYVPQDTYLIEGSIKRNICLGYNDMQITSAQLEYAVQRAQLSDFISTLPEGIETYVSEGGANLSGGQRQRIGIARALITQPKLLIMDEATSALDSQTESLVNASIQALRGQVTLIIIAHRLSTVKNADSIIYIEDGKIQSMGSLDEVRLQVPAFHEQAKLLGF